MEAILTAIKLLGGLAMFLYGMEVMGDGLKRGSGETLKKFLGRLTQNTLMGLVTGAVVTAIVQSSTAIIVLTVGLIGAGILNLRQAVSIVMGANIGTTITAQIIRLMDLETTGNPLLSFFKPDALAPVTLVLGIILYMFVKRSGAKNAGTICLGIGILFSGLLSMMGAVEPLADSPAFMHVMSYFSRMPVMGILVGLAATVLIQSSAAMVGILQALSSTGAMDFSLVYPMIMGINLGTCVTTAMVCSIGSSKDAKRTGVVHIAFNVIGTVIFMLVMTVVRRMGYFPELWNSTVNSGVIANFQTLFNLVTAVMLVPFTGALVKLSCRIVKDEPEQADRYPELSALDRKLMVSPAVALAQASRSVAAMARAAKENTQRGLAQFVQYDAKRAEEIAHCEERLDMFADAADNFLIELFPHLESERDNRQLNMVMQCVPALERVGDYATNFDEMAQKLADAGLSFSEGAQRELDILSAAVEDILDLTVQALTADDEEIARRIEPLEEVIDDMVLLLKDRHAARLRQGICQTDAGLVFIDTLTYLERAADQCSSIAMLMLGRSGEEIMKNHHRYLQELHASGDSSYLAEQEMRRQQYLVPLEQIEM